MQLRPYQNETIEAVFAAERRGVTRQLVVLPTGGGKTVVFASLLKQRPGRALVLAHRDELLQQAKAKILAVWPGARVGIVRGDLNETNTDVIVGSIQTLGRERRLNKLPRDFQTVIVDEAHHVKAATYGRILEYVAASNPLILGVTATPYRGDNKPICADDEDAKGDEPFAERVFTMDIAEAIDQGWLCDIEGRLITLKGADFGQIHTRRGDLDTKELEAMMMAANWQEHLFKAWTDHCQDKRTVVFVPPKRAMAWALESYFKEQGVSVAAVTGDQDASFRRGIYQRFAAGQIAALINCEVLTEGWDEPSVDCVMMARPTKSKTIYVQAVGRGLRLHPDKSACLVLDVCGVTQRHDLMSLASLTGVRRPKDGESFTRARARAKEEAEQEAQREAEEKARIEAEHEARRVELLRRQKERNDFFTRQAAPLPEFAWQGSLMGGQRLALTIGGQHYVFVVREVSGFWEAGLATNNDDWQGAVVLTAEGARRACEKRAKELREAMNTGWRAKPATDKQIATMRRLGVKHLSIFQMTAMTSGEASDLIGARLKELNKQREVAA